MEFSILYSIPHNEVLDSFFLGLTKITGSIAQLWIIVGLILLIFKKTRKTGAAVLIAYIGVFVFGQMILKHLIARPRPCQIDLDFPLLLERPSTTSFPSSHSAFSFGAATAIFMSYKKAGILAFIVAALIAYSRLYLFMHFPTDVLAGIILGIVLGYLSTKLCEKIFRPRSVPSDRS